MIVMLTVHCCPLGLARHFPQQFRLGLAIELRVLECENQRCRKKQLHRCGNMLATCACGHTHHDERTRTRCQFDDWKNTRLYHNTYDTSVIIVTRKIRGLVQSEIRYVQAVCDNYTSIARDEILSYGVRANAPMYVRSKPFRSGASQQARQKSEVVQQHKQAEGGSSDVLQPG